MPGRRPARAVVPARCSGRTAIGHRGANGQPGGRSTSSGGCPAIGTRGARSCAVHAGDGAEQADRVRHPRPREQLVHRRLLHRPPGVHHQHVVRGPGHHAEVVGDEDQRGAGLDPGEREHLEDLGLHRDVQRRRRLVGDDHLRVVGDRHRDDDPLPHPSGELVRERPGPASRRSGSRPGRAARPPASARRHGPAPGGPAAPRRSGAPPGRSGSATTSGPGRSCRARGRGPSTAPVVEAEQLPAVQTDRPGDGGVAPGSRPITASDMTDLPEPDSPTMPSVRPACRSRSTPRTASTRPASDGKETRRSRTDSTGRLTPGPRSARSGRARRAARRRSAPSTRSAA